MNWFVANPGLSAALLGIVAAIFGYFYRARSERKDNLKEALYLLLEIWHRMTMLSYNSHDQLVDSLLARFRKLYPNVTISHEQIQASKNQLVPALQRILTEQALSDFGGFQDAYKRVVRLIARSKPVYAFRLESVSGTRQVLESIDRYMNEAAPTSELMSAPSAILSNQLKRSVQDTLSSAAVFNMEKDILGLAFRISVWTWLDAARTIRRRRKRLIGLLNEAFSHEIDQFLKLAFDKAGMSQPIQS